jgi:hypothetical protein
MSGESIQEFPSELQLSYLSYLIMTRADLYISVRVSLVKQKQVPCCTAYMINVATVPVCLDKRHCPHAPRLFLADLEWCATFTAGIRGSSQLNLNGLFGGEPLDSLAKVQQREIRFGD